MAVIFSHSFFLILITISILLPSLPTGSTNEADDDLIHLIHKPMKQKLTHFRVYWHDVLSTSNPTSVPILKPLNTSTIFGGVNMMDAPLTLGPELSSKMVGRAQGFYGGASQSDNSLILAMNFVFTYGKYNGSTVTIVGRNADFTSTPIKEMPVIGGTGLLRFASGYARIRTYKFDANTGDATNEYNVYVMHY